jgi:chemotaxis signal transduction protein
MNEQNLAAENSPHTSNHLNSPHPELQASLIDLAIVSCAGMLIGIDVKWVREVRPFTDATPIYGLPPYWAGICALRGHLYAVLDLQQVLSHQQTPVKNNEQIVFTDVNEYSVGLLVDAVQVVRQVEVESIINVSTTCNPYILGSTPDQISLLDLPLLYDDLCKAAATCQKNI